MEKKFSQQDLTPRAIIIGSLLAVVLGAATTYLALRVGITVSASIPSIALCMAIFRILKPSNGLEVNLIQTIASAGYVVGSVAAFVLPGLIMVGAWQSFDYLHSFLVLALGCVFGVFLSVPLRSYYFQQDLPYPEGVAAANLIKAAMVKAKDNFAKTGLLFGTLCGAVLQFLQEGVRLIPSTLSFWKGFHGVPIGLSLGVSPSLIGVGYIIGFHASAVCFFSTLVSLFAGVPILGSMAGMAITTDVESSMMHIWSKQVRYVGVGVMLAGGVFLCLSLIKPIYKSMKAAALASKNMSVESQKPTEKDIRMRYVLISYVIFIAAVFLTALLPFSDLKAHLKFGLVPTMLILSMANFLFSAMSASIGGYMAGIIGSSYNPLSGVSIINICLFSTVISFLVDTTHLTSQTSLIALVLFMVTYAGGGCSISCDNIQDLKTGQLLGAEPWKQQIGLVIGAMVGALVVPIVLQALLEAYGIGNYHPGAVGPVDPTKTLQAPKAVLLSSLAKAIFHNELDWRQIYVGLALSSVIQVLNIFLKHRGCKTIPLLSVGVGIYMPMEITGSIFLGGLVYAIVQKKYNTSKDRVVIPSGLVAGEALAGVLIAFLLITMPQFALWRSSAATLIPCNRDCLAMIALVLLVGSLFFYGRGTFYPDKK